MILIYVCWGMLSYQKNEVDAIPVALDGDQELVFFNHHSTQSNELQAKKEFTPWLFGDTLGYVCGRRGSGKTWYISLYANNYYKYTGNKVIYISRFREDPSLNLPERQIMIHVSETSGLEMECFRNSLIIFDDIHDNQLTKVEKMMLDQFILDVIENSRKFGISALITSHMIYNYQKTRNILAEMSFIVVFPQFSNRYQIESALKRYVGLSSQQIDRIMSCPDRWVQIQTTTPKFILSSHSIYTYTS